MKSPGGWALAGMWYDKFPGTPPRGSPLERLFTLVYLSKQRAELLSMRAMVQVNMPDSREAQDPAIQAFEAYCQEMFPFLERATDQEKEEHRKRLQEFVKKRARFSMKPIWRQQAEHSKRLATLKRFMLKPTVPGGPVQMKVS